MLCRRPIYRFLLAALALPPAAMLGQAGLSGNALGGQAVELRANNSQWDKGLQSRSALGQLEELSGGKVSRSPNASRPQPPPEAPVRKTLSRSQQFNRSMQTAIAGAVIESVLMNILFDDSAARAQAQAEAEAAAAAAQAEAERQAELARIAQQQFAADLRAAWDARDRTMSDTLAGAFDTRAGTAFFGISANPDVSAAAVAGDESAPSTTETTPVYLPDRASLTVDPGALGMSVGGAGITNGPAIVPPARGYFARVDDPVAEGRSFELAPRTSAEAAALIAGEWYVDTMKDAVSDSAWSWVQKNLLHLPDIPGWNKVEAILEFKEKYETLSDPLQSKSRAILDLAFGGAQRGAIELGSLNRSGAGTADGYFDAFESLAGATRTEAYKLAFNDAAGRVVDGPEFGESEEVGFGEPGVTPLSGISKGRFGHLRIDR